MMTVTLQLHNQINAESDEAVIHKEEELIDIYSQVTKLISNVAALNGLSF